MARGDSSGTAAVRPRRRGYVVIASVTAAAVLAALGVLVGEHVTSAGAGPAAASARRAHLVSSSCSGPKGAAYVSESGYQAFAAINTKNCEIVQTYNVGDTQVPNDPGDFNYSSTNEGIAVHGSTLYFADAGNSTVAVINSSKLSPAKYYDPPEKLINVGLNPGNLAVTPDGTQLWVADTGPQTAPNAPSGISVISTATDKVLVKLPLSGGPTDIAFSPSGAQAFVTTSAGLTVYDTATQTVVSTITGLGDPESVAVSPDGSTLYVTNTQQNEVAVISAATDAVTGTISVGQLPWQLALSANGGTLYVADGDSDEVSVISTSSDTVTSTIHLAGDPVSLALTPNGSQLWVGGLTSAVLTVYDTATLKEVGSLNVGGAGPNSGDGDEPTAIVMLKTPTPGSNAPQAPSQRASRNKSGH